MMVANNEVNAKRFGIFNLINGLDAAIEYYNELNTVFGRPFYGLCRYSIALIVACRDIEVYFRVKILKIPVDEATAVVPSTS